MGEEILLDSNGVKVTLARAVIGGTTYAVANITSIKAARDVSKRNLGFLLLVIAVVLVAMKVMVPGLLVAAAGALCVYLGTVAVLVLTTGAAEQSVLRSRDQARIVEVASAVNLAIIKCSARMDGAR